MAEVIKLPRVTDDTMWAVIASIGRTNRVAEIYPTRMAALADRQWREQQVRAYAGFLSTCKQPAPRYSVAPMRLIELRRMNERGTSRASAGSRS